MFEIFIKSLVCRSRGGERPQIKGSCGCVARGEMTMEGTVSVRLPSAARLVAAEPGERAVCFHGLPVPGHAAPCR